MTPEAKSRDRVLSRPSNLDFLLTKRTEFLREYLTPGSHVLEVGAGVGTVSCYVRGLRLVTTDMQFHPWLDVVADVTRLPFCDEGFDAVVCLHVLHHLAYPITGLREMVRVVRPGGLLLIAEPHTSLILRIALALTGHEYIDGEIDPFGTASCQTGEAWGKNGNNVIGDHLFGDINKFCRTLPELVVEHHRFVECLMFLNSGGVGFRAPYVPLPRFALTFLGRVDNWLCSFPSVFPLCREIVFRKKK